MLDVDLAAMRRRVEGLDYQPLFVTVSGAHLYGFPSADSDVDLRGCHRLPLQDIVGIDVPSLTLEHKTIHDGTEVELVSQLRRGMALWKVGRHSFLVEHRLASGERWLADTDQAMSDTVGAACVADRSATVG